MQNNFSYSLLRRLIATIIVVIISGGFKAQISNYVSNGGFEECVDINASFKRAKFWDAADTNKAFAELLSHTISPYFVPKSSYTYQWPRHGSNFIGSLQYCTSCTYNTRGYPRNRLKKNLESGKTYCFSMYVNLTNQSSYAIDALGAYFSDASTDTIKHCTKPLPFLTPQIQNTPHTFINDTLNWVLLRGTYTANGTEKYLFLGNFKTDQNTDTLFINSTVLPDRFSSYLYDDISCIDIDLPAFAGRDTVVVPGDSIYIGRESDVGIDEDCFWYKLPMVITPTTTAIDTVAGLWIKPVTSCTYVVRQDICGNVKWDTVVIYMNPVGLEKLKLITEELKLFPVPAKDQLDLNIFNEKLIEDFTSLIIYNSIGLKLREEEVVFRNNSLTLKLDDLPAGVYTLQLINNKKETVSKRFVIAR